MKKPIHFRRCHHCGSLNHNPSNRVERCIQCERTLAPFFYFDERLMAIQSDGHLRPPQIEGEYKPILGLTAYWDEPSL